MNREIVPINCEAMTKDRIRHLICLSESKAGISDKRSGTQMAKLLAGLAAAVCMTVIGAVFFALSGNVPAAANEDEFPDHRILRNALNAGRYYLDGIISEAYVEVYEDGTLQWKDPELADKLREADIGQAEAPGGNTVLTEEQEKAIAETADWAAAPHKYTVVYWKFVDKTMVMLDWDEDNNSGGNGYDYIDRNTISIGYGGRTYTFIYIGA